MNKLITALVVLSSLGFAQVQGVSVSAVDAVPPLNNYLGLEISAKNSGSVVKKVRASYELPSVTKGVKYKVDNVLADNIAEEGYGNCWVRLGSEDNLIYNFRESSDKFYLDMQFSLKPGDNKTFCFPVMRTDLAEFLDPDDDVQDGLKYDVVEAGSPLDNKIVYNYIPKARYSSMVDEYEANVVSVDLSVVEPIPAEALFDLDMDSYGAYKDTRMLIASAGPLVDYYRWNESTFDGHMYNGAEERSLFVNRTWAISLFNIYSHYYGNRNTKADALTQDEIVYRGKVAAKRNLQHEIFSTKGDEETVAITVAVMNEIMPDANVSAQKMSKEPLSGPSVLGVLKKETPVIIRIPYLAYGENGSVIKSYSCHFALIDAMALTLDDKQDTLVHVVGVDNAGSERFFYWDFLKQYITDYITFDVPTGFEKTDMVYPVDWDSDNDGIVDFDEQYRFFSDPNEADSDGDLIPDFNEVYSYISRMEATASSLVYVGDVVRSGFGVSPFIAQNIDAKDLPQNNPDFDGDGITDGEEDLNGNGIYEPSLGETDPFTKGSEEIPSDIVIYAFEELHMGKDVHCEFAGYSSIPAEPLTDEAKDGYIPDCNVAVSSTYGGDYTIEIDKNSSLNHIYSGGMVLIEENTSVFMASLYGNFGIIDDMNVSTQTYSINYPYDQWKFNPVVVLPDSKKGEKATRVPEGEVLVIHDGDVYKSIEVMKGGIIRFDAGEMYIGSIKFEYGSTYDLQNAGYATILHVNGPVEWYGTLDGKNPDRGSLRNIVVKTFKLYQHSEEETIIDTRWYGTIVAPQSRLTLGVTDNADIIAGHFLGKYVTVGSSIDLYQYNFDAETKPVVVPEEKDTVVADTIVKDTVIADTTVKDSADVDTTTKEPVVADTTAKDSAAVDTTAKEPVVADTTVKDTTVKDTTVKDTTEQKEKDEDAIIANNKFVGYAPKIVGMNRNELSFVSASASGYQVVIAKVNGSKVASYSFENGRIGVNMVSLADARLSTGRYFVTIKQNGLVSSKLLIVK